MSTGNTKALPFFQCKKKMRMPHSQKKPESPKIIPTLFLAAATLSAVKNIDVIIFGPTGFFGLLTSFADFQHILCQILSEKFSCQISCQISSVNFDTRFLT